MAFARKSKMSSAFSTVGLSHGSESSTHDTRVEEWLFGFLGGENHDCSTQSQCLSSMSTYVEV